MIHYHGSPVGCPADAAARFWIGRHAFVSYADTSQLPVIADACQSFAIDNGAFTAWRAGTVFDWSGYVDFCERWRLHPGCDFCVIPDVIDGSPEDNDALIADWPAHINGAPVWHMHEPIERLAQLARTWRIVALGSSGEWPTPGAGGWWERMANALDAICDTNGRPLCKLHGLRMLSPDIFPHLPLSSADSTNAARNAGNGARWSTYAPRHVWQRAGVIADRIESFNSAPVWQGEVQQCLGF